MARKGRGSAGSEFVSYDEFAAKLGVSRKTLERKVRKREAPQPQKISANMTRFTREQVNQYIDELKTRFEATAAVAPEKLTAENIQATIIELAAELFSDQHDCAVRPDQIEARFYSDRSDYETRHRLISILAELCRDFDEQRATFVASAIFESIRRAQFRGLDRIDDEVLANPIALQAVAALALHDENWEEFAKHLRDGSFQLELEKTTEHTADVIVEITTDNQIPEQDKSG